MSFRLRVILMSSSEVTQLSQVIQLFKTLECQAAQPPRLPVTHHSLISHHSSVLHCISLSVAAFRCEAAAARHADVVSAEEVWLFHKVLVPQCFIFLDLFFTVKFNALSMIFILFYLTIQMCRLIIWNLVLQYCNRCSGICTMTAEGRIREICT